MRASRPIAVSIPSAGVYFAESVHTPDFAMRPRADGYHKLLYVLRGEIRYQEAERAPERLAAGAVLLVPARTRHVIADEHASTLLLLCVTGAFLRGEPEVGAIWARLTAAGRRQVVTSGPARAALENGWRRALLEQAHPRAAFGAAMRALALQTFVHLARLPEVPPRQNAVDRVLTVARDLETTFFDRWTLDAAAARAGMSRRHFSARFRAALGRTFWEHLTEVRLAHAARLLRQGGHSVTGVIFACGFGDVSQFYRLFRERYGLPPKAWAGAPSPQRRDTRAAPPSDESSTS